MIFKVRIPPIRLAWNWLDPISIIMFYVIRCRYVINESSVLYFYERSSGASHIFEEESCVIEFDLGVVSAYALVQDENLVGAVPAYFGSFFFDWKERGLRAIILVNHKFILFFFVFLFLIHHDIHLLGLLLLAEAGLQHLNWNNAWDVLIGLALEAGLFFKDRIGHVVDFGLGGDFP